MDPGSAVLAVSTVQRCRRHSFWRFQRLIRSKYPGQLTQGERNFNFTQTYRCWAAVGIAGIQPSTPARHSAYTAAINAGGSVPQNTYNIVGAVWTTTVSDRTLLFFRYANCL